MTATPQPIQPDILGDKISELLERNGSLTQKEWRQLMTYFVQDMRADIKTLMDMPKEIHVLRKTNLVLWFREHSTLRKTIIAFTTLTSVSIYALLLLHAKDAIPVIVQVIDFVKRFI